MKRLSTSTLLTALIVPGFISPVVAAPATEVANADWLIAQADLSGDGETVPVMDPEITPEIAPEITPEIAPENIIVPSSEEGETFPEVGGGVAPQGAIAVQILSPTMGAVLESNAAAVVLEAPIGSQITLKVNGVAVDSNQVGQLETNSSTGTMRQTWYGVIFEEGENTLTAIATKDGQTVTNEIELQSPGSVSALRLTTIEKRVPADGRSTVTVQGFLLDDNGNISNRGGRITLTPSSGKFMGVDASPDAQGFQVDAKNGRFEALLQSSVNSGITQIRADLFELEAFTQVQFETALRPSLMTGVIDFRLGAENTNYFGSFSEFLAPDATGETVLDVDGAAFAIGPIGEWLLTAAFNGDRPLNEACETCTNRLYRADQKSENPYPTYGDESTLSNLTPSQDQVFVRLERSSGILGADPDYAMWGDYSTAQEFATSSQEFSALSRQLHGAKINYNLGDLQISGLYSQGGESFQRDTILPDGTTGFYFLTQRLVIPGSEEIYLELEELERPGTIIQRDRLLRGTDYDIDYDRGSIVFTDPMLRTETGDEGQILVRRIVAAYQHESDDENKLYAGRLRYNFSREQNANSWIGTSYFKEDKGERDLEVFGIDSQVSFGENYKLIGEYARSDNDSSELGNISGSAYRLDFTGKFSNSITGRAYYRHADTGFSNQSTISFVPGQTRYGADLDAKLSDTTQLRLRYDHENNDGVNIRPIVTLGDLLAADDEGIPQGVVDNRLTTISAGIVQKLGRSNLSLDLIYRDREDRINPDSSGDSTQLRSRFTTPLLKDLRLNLTNETTLSASTDAVYNDRIQAGLDWRALPGLNVALNQNWYTRGSLAGQSTTSVNIGGQYRLWKDAAFTGRYSFENFSTGIEDSLGFGLKQRWTISPGLHLDAAYEKVVGNLFFGGDGSVNQGGNRSTRVRGGDSLSFRASYTDNPNFQTEARYEWRNTNDSSTSNVSASVLGKLSPSLTTLFNFDRRFAAGRATRDLPASTDIRLGLAYRNPYSDKFNALLRYEYRHNPDTIPETILLGTGNSFKEHLFAGELIYAPNWQWEFYTKLAYRHSSIDLADNFSASSSLGLAQVRATYQMNRWVDLTLGGRWIRQFSAGYDEMGWVGEVGFHATPNLRLAVGYSSGEINQDRDFSGTRAGSGLYAGVTLKLDRLFDGFGLQEPLPNPQVRRQLVVENTETEKTMLQASLPQQKPEPLRLDVSQTIEFAPNTDAMSGRGQAVLESLVMVLSQYPDLNIDIQGKLPPLAELTPDNLEAKRLQTARAYLLSRGIQGDRIVIRSIGQAAETTAQETRQDRLVSFALTGSADTFELLSNQLNNEIVGSLLGESLPQLAQRSKPEDSVATADNLPAQPRQVAVLPDAERRQPPTVVEAFSGSGEKVFTFESLTLAPVVTDEILISQGTMLDRQFLSQLIGDSTQLTLAQVPRASEEIVTVETPIELAARPDEVLVTGSGADEEILLGDRRLDENGEEIILGDRRLDENGEEIILGDRRLDENGEEIILGDRRLDENREEIILGDRRLDADPTGVTFLNLDQWTNIEMPTFTSLNLDLTNGMMLSQLPDSVAITTQDFTTIITDRETLALMPTTLTEDRNRLSYLQARQLENALTFLLSRDTDALDALLQAAADAPRLRGEVIDLDRLMERGNELGGQL